MADYLIHQGANGVPLGVFVENAHYYFPENSDHEEYGVAAVEQQGPSTNWADWIDSMSDRVPRPDGQWTVYNHDPASLEDVLTAAVGDTGYPDD